MPTWHDCGVTDQGARYDRIAEGYSRWWSPIHRPATLALLDEIEAPVAAGATRILDVGCGTGALVAAAAGRWPRAQVTGVDLSHGMLALAKREVDALPATVRRRVTLAPGGADQLPFADGSFDIVLSAFVLQLVPSRHRALREARRVLSEGGSLSCVTWLPGGSMPADEVVDAVLAGAGVTRGEPGGSQRELRSPGDAVALLRRAGFESVSAHADVLDHRYTPEGYLAFVSEFDDQDLFESLGSAGRKTVEAVLMERLRTLPPEGLRMRLPTVYATGRRSSRS